MTHVITSVCMQDNGRTDVCHVECIQLGSPIEQWPTYYIDPATCIDCGACVPECPFAAIFPEDEVPAAYEAAGGEYINRTGLTGHYDAFGRRGQGIVLETTKVLAPGEVEDLLDAISLNRQYVVRR